MSQLFKEIEQETKAVAKPAEPAPELQTETLPAEPKRKEADQRVKKNDLF